MEERHRTFSIRIPDALYDRMMKVVSKDGRYRSMNQVVVTCIMRGIKTVEAEDENVRRAIGDEDPSGDGPSLGGDGAKADSHRSYQVQASDVPARDRRHDGRLSGKTIDRKFDREPGPTVPEQEPAARE